MPLHDPQIPPDAITTPTAVAEATEDCKPREISKPSKSSFVLSLSDQDELIYKKVLDLLAEHLGSKDAAISWLKSSGTGYPGTALEAIQQGHANLVLVDLETQWGLGPSYA